MSSKLKLNEVVLTSPNGLVEKSVTMGDDGIVSLPDIEVNGDRPIINEESDVTPIRKSRFITQATYNALGTLDANTVYFIVG